MLAVDSRHCVLIDRFGRALDAPEDANIVELHLSAPVHATFAVRLRRMTKRRTRTRSMSGWSGRRRSVLGCRTSYGIMLHDRRWIRPRHCRTRLSRRAHHLGDLACFGTRQHQIAGRRVVRYEGKLCFVSLRQHLGLIGPGTAVPLVRASRRLHPHRHSASSGPASPT